LSRVGKDLYGGEVTTQNDSSDGQPDWSFMPLLDLNTPAKNVHCCVTLSIVAIPQLLNSLGFRFCGIAVMDSFSRNEKEDSLPDDHRTEAVVIGKWAGETCSDRDRRSI
jgi:hypothetical protein